MKEYINLLGFFRDNIYGDCGCSYKCIPYAYNVVDFLDAVTEGLKCRDDHLVPECLGDEDNVLADDRLERLLVQLELLHRLHLQGLQGLQHLHHVAQAGVGHAETSLGQFLEDSTGIGFSN